jgi:hypothetical protein
MRQILLLGTLLLAALYSIQAIAADDRCGGVWMATRSLGSPNHKMFVEKLGFYSIDGGLVMNGESTCTSIHIECEKTNGICRTATAVTNLLQGHAQVLGVFISDDYKITEWTRDTVSAETHTLNSGVVYLHIVINDEVPDKVEIIQINKSLIEKPGEWVTEVLTVDNDPSLTKLLRSQTEH